MLPQLPASQAAAAPCESVAEWWPRHRAIAAEHPDPIHQAIVGGFVADRVGWAFASGYQAALRALFPDAPADRICALCVTEADGNSPKAIKSSPDEDRRRLAAERVQALDDARAGRRAFLRRRARRSRIGAEAGDQDRPRLVRRSRLEDPGHAGRRNSCRKCRTRSCSSRTWRSRKRNPAGRRLRPVREAVPHRGGHPRPGGRALLPHARRAAPRLAAGLAGTAVRAAGGDRENSPTCPPRTPRRTSRSPARCRSARA